MARNRSPLTHATFFILPWLIVFAVFWLYPFFFSLYLSFTRYSMIDPGGAQWIGLENYHALIHDELFWVSLKNTSVFAAVTIPITLALAVAIAQAIHHTKKFQSVFRSAVFLPSAVSVTVLSLVFIQFYSHDGYVNWIAGLIGIGSADQGILLNDRTALAGIMAMDILISSGYFSILFLAAMKNIPVDLYESADIAGANGRQKFRYITLPLLRPVMAFCVVVSTIKSMQLFTEILLMTKGGPLHATTTLVYRIYELGFREFKMGYASAMAYVLLVIVGLLAWLQMRFLRKASV